MRLQKKNAPTRHVLFSSLHKVLHQSFHRVDCQQLFVQSKIERTNLRLTNNIYLILNGYI